MKASWLIWSCFYSYCEFQPQCSSAHSWNYVWSWRDSRFLKAWVVVLCFCRDTNLCSSPDCLLKHIFCPGHIPVLLHSPQFQVSHFTFGTKYSVYSIKNVFLLPLFPSPLLFCFYFWPPSSVAHVLDRHAPPALLTLTLAQPPPAPERPPTWHSRLALPINRAPP